MKPVGGKREYFLTSAAVYRVNNKTCRLFTFSSRAPLQANRDSVIAHVYAPFIAIQWQAKQRIPRRTVSREAGCSRSAHSRSSEGAAATVRMMMSHVHLEDQGRYPRGTVERARMVITHASRRRPRWPREELSERAATSPSATERRTREHLPEHHHSAAHDRRRER